MKNLSDITYLCQITCTVFLFHKPYFANFLSFPSREVMGAPSPETPEVRQEGVWADGAAGAPEHCREIGFDGS